MPGNRPVAELLFRLSVELRMVGNEGGHPLLLRLVVPALERLLIRIGIESHRVEADRASAGGERETEEKESRGGFHAANDDKKRTAQRWKVTALPLMDHGPPPQFAVLTLSISSVVALGMVMRT